MMVETRHRQAWAVAVLFLATFAVSQVARPVAAARPAALDSIPMTFSAWAGKIAPPLDPETTRILGADQYVHRFYAMAGAPTIEMDVAYYAQPRVGATAHSPLNCLPGNGWTMSEPALREIKTATDTWTVRDLIVSRDDARWAMTYWFQGRQRIEHDEFAARWHLFTDALSRRPADTTMVRVMTPVAGTSAAERALLATFAADLIPAVNLALANER